MSFAYDVKKELCMIKEQSSQSKDIELYAMLLFSKHFNISEIKLKSENVFVINKFTELIMERFSPIIEKTSRLKTKKSSDEVYTARVIDSLECRRICEYFGRGENELNLRINRGIIDDLNDVSAFLRGVFLSCGSVSDPQKSYHLEFCVPYKKLSQDLCSVIGEVEQLDISPKTLVRNGSFVVYIKDSEQICDLLTYMGAFNCAMDIMGTKALKQVRNSANRRANSEFANLQKIASASAAQINAINKIKEKKGLGYLSDELLSVALLRLENPELSLRDLGQQLTPPISRSGVNHRLTKIIEIANDIKG